MIRPHTSFSLLTFSEKLRSHRVQLAFSLSIFLHLLILFGIGIALPKLTQNSQTLEVVLVNSKSKNLPHQANALAQSNLDGGGNTSEEHRIKTPLPTLSEGEKFTPEQATKHVKELEREAKRLMTKLKSNYTVAPEKRLQAINPEPTKGEDLTASSFELARLEAQISKSLDAYEKMPRRKFVGARTQEYRYAQYMEDWRSKIEHIGNLNYPQQARDQKIYGKLTLTVAIRADGSVENIEINRSSGQKILDAAAIRIVNLAAPYAPFPPDVRKDTDILSITRTWSFTVNDQMESE